MTAGPTIEDIDPVRFISNRATGKLGVEIARAALRRGYRVILIHGPLADDVRRSIPVSARLTAAPVRAADEMHKAVLKHVAAADTVFMSAAVADYAPARKATAKLKKSSRALTLRLKPTVDILARLGALKRRRQELVLIGFALETGRGRTERERETSRLAEARRKLRAKNLDAIVLDTPETMGAERSDFTVVGRSGERARYREVTKVRLARELVEAARNMALTSPPRPIR